MALNQSLVIHIPSVVVHAAIRGAHIATATRYLSVAGLVTLLYDHLLTFGDEVNLIWTAPRSFLKWVFLTNHYLVEICLIAINAEMSGFGDFLYDDQKFMTTVACYAIISTFVANFLVFLRVIILWDKSPRIVLALSIVLTVNFLMTVTCMIASTIILEPAIRYDPTLKTCHLTKSAKPFILLWAAPLSFDIVVLAFTIYNSLSSPRDLKTTLRRTLYRDGILFFLLVASMRTLNLIFANLTEPGLSSFPVNFSWAVITLACRRLLIHIRSCEQEATYCNDLHASLSRNSSVKTDFESAIELRSYKDNCR